MKNTGLFSFRSVRPILPFRQTGLITKRALLFLLAHSIASPHTTYMLITVLSPLFSFSSLITPTSGGFLAHPTQFDPLEFNIPPADAAALPLATRKLIEHAFLALRDAGVNYRGADVGVYTAGVGHDASMLGEAVSLSLPFPSLVLFSPRPRLWLTIFI
jgi:hypothetical protein